MGLLVDLFGVLERKEIPRSLPFYVNELNDDLSDWTNFLFLSLCIFLLYTPIFLFRPTLRNILEFYLSFTRGRAMAGPLHASLGLPSILAAQSLNKYIVSV
jgi:hypothetical protein